MKQTPYTGKVSGMKTSPWLGSEDLLGISPVKLTIVDVIANEDVAMDGGRVEKLLYSITLNRGGKAMILNATNRRTLSAAFGADTQQWRGKEVELYVEDGIRKPGGKRGETTTGLRIKAKPDPALAQQRRAEVTGGGQ